MSESAKKLAGRFIVIDGPDGSGKTTQLKLLAEDLRSRGVEVVTARDPGGTAIGDKIRRLLLDPDHPEMTPACETMLYMASRAQLAAEVIRPALAAGKCVCCDRYVSATVAYQGAGGIDADAVRRTAELAVGGLWPDLTMILDVPARQGLGRLAEEPDRMEAKTVEFHRRVREIFLEQAERAAEHFIVINGDGSIDEVHERVMEGLVTWAEKPAKRPGQDAH